MTPEQKAAFILSQVAMLTLEVEMMKAANMEREHHGHALAYSETQFADLFKQFEPVLGHNAVLAYFQA